MTFENEQGSRLANDRTRRSRASVEQGDLAEDLAGSEIGKDDLLARRAGKRDADETIQDRHHAGSRIADLEQHFPRTHALADGSLGELPAIAFVKFLEQTAGAQYVHRIRQTWRDCSHEGLSFGNVSANSIERVSCPRTHGQGQGACLLTP